MIINYKLMRDKREKVKQTFREQRDISSLITLAQAIADAYEASLELPGPTWADPEGTRHRYVSCGTFADKQFTQMPLSEISATRPVVRGFAPERIFDFFIKTIIDTTPKETACVYTSVTIRENDNHEPIVDINQSAVPLSTGNFPYTTVCEAIQYHVMNEIENLRPDGEKEIIRSQR